MSVICVYTPFVNNSKFIPHIVEHCIFWKISNIDLYFQYYNIDVYVRSFITVFNIEWNDDIALVKILQRPLDISCIRYEYGVIKQECLVNNYWQLLFEKIWKILVHKDFNNNHIETLNIQGILDYHLSYYQNWNFFILNNNLLTKTLHLLPPKINQTIHVMDNTIYVFNFSTEAIFFCYFLVEMLNEYLCFIMRFRRWQYDFQECAMMFYEKYVIISVYDIWVIRNIPIWFFDRWCINFMSNIWIKLKYFKELDGVMLIKYGYTITLNEKKKMIQKVYDFYLSIFS